MPGNRPNGYSRDVKKSEKSNKEISQNIWRVNFINRRIKLKKRFVKILSLALGVVMLCTYMLGCSNGGSGDGGEKVTQSDLMQGIVSGMVAERNPDEKYYEALRMVISAIAVKNLSAKENSAVSPLTSVFNISLIANALSDKTQSELLHALSDFKMTALNEYNATYAHKLKNEAGATVYSSFRISSDKKSLAPEKSFLQLSADYYGADGYLLDFAGSDVNALLSEWVTAKIGIQGLTVDAKCAADAVSLLAGTLSFTDSFEIGFSGKETGSFSTADGEKEISYLISEETLYAETAKSKGFAKTMKNGYTFVALAPQGTATLEQLVQSLDAAALKTCYDGISEKAEFKVKIPEFSFGYSTSVTAAIKSLGIKAVFEKSNTLENEKAQLTVDNIVNITAVGLNENGFTTSATAPAAVQQQVASSEELPLTVFDKPFVFIVFDTAGIPLTLGTVVNP